MDQILFIYVNPLNSYFTYFSQNKQGLTSPRPTVAEFNILFKTSPISSITMVVGTLHRLGIPTNTHLTLSHMRQWTGPVCEITWSHDHMITSEYPW